MFLGSARCASVSVYIHHDTRVYFRPTSGTAKPPRSLKPVACAAASETADVVVVGSGIIGLCVTRKLLTATDLSVVLLDKKQPCAGATGAGQGYIWLAHRDPASPSWPLARHSKALWEQLAAQAHTNGHINSLADSLEWQANGSMLLATTAAEVQQLEARAVMLQQQGIPGVLLLSPRELKMHEPALQLPTGSIGLLVSSDAQINGKRTAFAMLEDCQQLAGCSKSSHQRLQVGLNEAVMSVEAHEHPQGVTVVTERRRIRARRGVIIAAGVWSGQLLAACLGQPTWKQLLQPRRGHLLEMQPPQGMPKINAGMMELSYAQHYSTTGDQPPRSSVRQASHSSTTPNHTGVDITFTATTGASGSLLIGSSREFSGWDCTPSKTIIAAIMARASTFLPALSSITTDQLLDSTRVGLRPYSVGGLPAVGPVPGLPNVVVAAGHEGSGLCLGPATAELVMHHLLGSQLQQETTGVDDKSLALAAAELLPENCMKRLAQ